MASLPMSDGAVEGSAYPPMSYTIDQIEHILALTEAHAGVSPDRILLSKGALSPEERRLVALQLASRPSLTRKLPHWAEVGVFVPSSLALEQCSSWEAARYKQRFVRPEDRVMDLTGGLGVDFAALREVATAGVYVERSGELVSAVTYNLPRLLPDHPSSLLLGSSTELLSELIPRYAPTLLFLDPARREGGDSHRRVYAIEDCEPDLLTLLPRLMHIYMELGLPLPRLLIKLSPMLDVTHTLQQVPYVQELHIVAVEGEVKELLLLLDLGQERAEGAQALGVSLTAVNLLGQGRTPQSFTLRGGLQQEASLQTHYATELGSYLYEPHAALMKSGLFRSVARHYTLQLLHPGTHLYTSQELVSDFPGRSFRIEVVYPFASSVLRRLGRELPAAQITCRNFSLTPEALRAKLRLREDSALTLFALTLSPSVPLLVLCQRV